MQAGRELQLDARTPGSPWTVLAARMGGNEWVLGAFAALYAVLVVYGMVSREPASGLTIVWPAAGLLLVALWLSERRLWAWILLIQVGLELLAGSLQSHGLTASLLSATLAHTLGGLVGAVIARRALAGPQGLRVTALLLFACAAAVGALLDALLQTIAASLAAAPVDVARHALLAWLSGLLGMLTTVPVLMSWLVSHRFAQSFPPLSRARRMELAAVAAVQLGVVLLVFSEGGQGGPEPLRFPVLAIPVLIYAAFRVPPRWTTALMGGTGLLALWLVARGGNPLGIQDPVTRLLWIQFCVLIFSLTVDALSVYIGQSQIAHQQLAASQSRYRSFIEMSSEAVWRIELMQPMPVQLPLAQQLEWLRDHARVVESSTSFEGFAGGAGAVGRGGWAADIPWVRLFEADLELIQRQEYRVHDLRVTVPVEGRARTFLTSFSGVVRDGHLERIWGVARDATELLELNARLLREQELLRSYAQRIASAEEGARRETAAGLHDGIGQELVAMGMMLTVLGNQLTPEQRAQLDELRGRLHRVQQRTRDLISDLSPPGLYDLGLVPALQWLVVYLRGHDRLQVDMDSEVDEAAVPIELRVLVFKLVRELLRNVVKHAGVDSAAVRIRGNRARLLVEVRDQGGGFDWDPDNLARPRRGFGLWSIADRLAAVGGQLGVDSAPGRGARFTLEIPLRS